MDTCCFVYLYFRNATLHTCCNNNLNMRFVHSVNTQTDTTVRQQVIKSVRHRLFTTLDIRIPVGENQQRFNPSILHCFNTPFIQAHKHFVV